MIVSGEKKAALLFKNILVVIFAFSFFFVIVTFAIANDGVDSTLYVPIVIVFFMIFYIILEDCIQFLKAPSQLRFNLIEKQVLRSSEPGPFQCSKLFFVANSDSAKSYRVAFTKFSGEHFFLTRHYCFDKSIGEIRGFLSRSGQVDVAVMSSGKYCMKAWKSR